MSSIKDGDRVWVLLSETLYSTEVVAIFHGELDTKKLSKYIKEDKDIEKLKSTLILNEFGSMLRLKEMVIE